MNHFLLQHQKVGDIAMGRWANPCSLSHRFSPGSLVSPCLQNWDVCVCIYVNIRTPLEISLGTLRIILGVCQNRYYHYYVPDVIRFDLGFPLLLLLPPTRLPDPPNDPFMMSSPRRLSFNISSCCSPGRKCCSRSGLHDLRKNDKKTYK